MTRRASSLYLLAVLAATGCASRAVRTTLPTAEREIADLLPEDAYFAARADVAAIRVVPGWDAIAAALDATDPTAAQRWRAIDTVYFAIGGLEQVVLPPAATHEPETPRGEETAIDPTLAEPTVDVPAEPEWVSTARTLGDRAPRIVIAFEGEDVSMCHALVEGGTRRRLGDYDVVTKDGFSFALRGRSVCVGTLEVMLEDVLASRHGTPRIVGRLHAAGEDGDAGLFGVAFELDAPGFTALMDALAEGARTPRDGAPFPDPLAEFRRVAERVSGELLRGIEAVEWQLGRSGASYASRTRVQASDVDRGVMYRELVEIVLGIIATVGESDVAGAAAGHVIDTLTATTRVEPREDGFVLVSRVSDAFVTEFLDGFVSELSAAPDETPDELSEALTDDDEEDFPTAQERIAALEPRRDAMLADPDEAFWLIDLASAYAHVGRTEEARVLLSRLVAAVPDYDAGMVVAERVELELHTGHAAEALAVVSARLEPLLAARHAATGDAESAAYLDLEIVKLRALGALCRALLGEADALRELDDFVPGDPMESAEMLRARGRAALARGRNADAAHTLGVFCGTSEFCTDLERIAMIEAFARSGASVERVDALIERFVPGHDPEGERDDAYPTSRYLGCLVRVLRAPQAERTRELCAAAEGVATASHGATHPITAAVTLEHARVRRDADGVRQALARVDAVLATLGPTHPLRAQRAAFGRRR